MIGAIIFLGLIIVLAIFLWSVVKTYRLKIITDLKTQLENSEPIPTMEFICPCPEQNVQTIPFRHNTIGYICSKCEKRINIIQTIDTVLALDEVNDVKFPIDNIQPDEHN